MQGLRRHHSSPQAPLLLEKLMPRYPNRAPRNGALKERSRQRRAIELLGPPPQYILRFAEVVQN